MPTAARRPLRTRDARWARTLATWLVNRRVPPNWISLASLGFAAAGALAMLAAPAASPGGRAALFVLAAACIQLRLLCNMLDGMVAVEGGLGSRAGDIYNELPDRIADPLLIVPAGYATGFALGPELGWIAGMLALLHRLHPRPGRNLRPAPELRRPHGQAPPHGHHDRGPAARRPGGAPGVGRGRPA